MKPSSSPQEPRSAARSAQEPSEGLKGLREALEGLPLDLETPFLLVTEDDLRPACRQGHCRHVGRLSGDWWRRIP